MDSGKKSPLRSIKEFCIECSGDSFYEVKRCGSVNCKLYPFRLGKNPYAPKRELSEEQKAEMRERLNRAREAKKGGAESE